MNKEKRYQEIIKLLERKAYLSVKELSGKLFVSEPTIRRDLDVLYKQGKISRYRGGAKRLDLETEEIPRAFRKNFKQLEKRKLALTAAKLVQDGDVIFLDGSTTVLFIPEFLKSKNNITIITNSLHVVTFAQKHHLEVFCTGGFLLKKSMVFIGEEAFNSMKNFNIDIFFFSAKGVSFDGKILDSSYHETVLRRKVIETAKMSVFLFDSEKMGVSAPYVVDSLDKMDYLISNGQINENLTETASVSLKSAKFIEI